MHRVVRFMGIKKYEITRKLSIFGSNDIKIFSGSMVIVNETKFYAELTT